MRKNLSGTLITIVLLAAAGPVLGQSFDDYFPVAVGKQWQYDVALMIGDAVNKSGKVTATNQGPAEIKGRKVIPRKYEQKGQIGETQYSRYFIQDASGIALLGYQGPKNLEPVWFDQPYYYLQGPLKAGTAWGQGTGAEGKIVSMDEEVPVPAGKFKNCLKVDTVFRSSGQEGTLESTFWFAKGVGIVKSEHRFPPDKKIVYQLTSVK